MTDQATTNRFKANERAVLDRTRRFGYSGGVPNLAMDAKKSGLDCNPIVGGKLLLFVPGRDGYLGGWDDTKGGYKRLHTEIMPGDYAVLVERRFHTGEDFGYRNLKMLTKVPYAFEDGVYTDEAYAYFDTLHPKCTCPYGLNQSVQTSDPEVGESEMVYQHCPTCQLEELKSEACSQRIYQASATLDSRILADLRAVLIEANEAALRHVNGKSQMVLSDIARKMTGQMPGRNTLNTIDRIHLKMMHKEESVATSDSAAMIKSLATEMAKAFQAAPAPVAPVNTLSAEEVAEYEAYKARKAQMAKARESRGKKGETNEGNNQQGHGTDAERGSSGDAAE